MTLSAEYMAGFFDGEGSVYAATRRAHANKTPTVTVCITNTNLAVLQAHKSAWGGSLSPRKLRPRNQRQYQWVLCAKQAYYFLSAIVPHLIIKKEVVTVALALCELQRRPPRERMTYETVRRRGRNWVSPRVKPEHANAVWAMHSQIRNLNSKACPMNALRSYQQEKVA